MVRAAELGYLPCSAGGCINSCTWDPSRIGEILWVHICSVIFPKLNLPRFAREDDSEGAISLLDEVKFCENWITHAAWSPWLVHSGERCIYFSLSARWSLTSVFCSQVFARMRHGRRRCFPHKYFSEASVTRGRWLSHYL